MENSRAGEQEERGKMEDGRKGISNIEQGMLSAEVKRRVPAGRFDKSIKKGRLR